MPDPWLAITAVSSVSIAYTYLGYPLLIGVLSGFSRRKSAPPEPQASATRATASVSVLLPIFNAASNLPAKIESLLAQDYPAEKLEILIFCDGCEDDSESVARRLAARPEAKDRIRVLAEAARRGKPARLNTLAAEAKGDLLLLTDARQPLSPNAVRALSAEFGDPKVGCATGRLILSGAGGSGAYWRYEDWIRSKESLFRGVVGMTGAISMMRRSDFAPLPNDVILDDVWIPMRLVLLGKTVVSVRVAEAYDTAFADDQEFRRKVRTLAGNYQLFAMLPALLLPLKNRLWWETFSHKVMRLLAPWLLLASYLASLAAAIRESGVLGTLSVLAFVGQSVFYLAAAVGKRAGRLASLARTFVVLNAAAVVGLARFLRGQQRVTW